MFLNSLMQVTSCIANIARITRATLKFVDDYKLVSQQLVVYKFQCGSCDASYVGYTARHLHQRIEEHRYSAIGRHRLADHGQTTAPPAASFSVLKKCASKFDCLIHEMFYIKELKPSLNVQSDSVRAKLFT